MKYKTKILVLVVALSCLFAGCGEQPASSVSATEVPAAFGMESIADVPEEVGTVTEGADPSSQNSLSTIENAPGSAEAETPVEKDLTQLAVKSAVCAVYLDGLTYNGMEPVYFWRAVGYLIGQVGEQSPDVSVDGDVLKVAAEDIAPFVEALFGPYESQYPSLGEENPLVASEYGEEGEIFLVTPWDLSSMEVTMSEPERQGDGSYRCQAELLENGTSVGNYIVTLEEYVPSEGKTPLFSYSITGLEEQMSD